MSELLVIESTYNHDFGFNDKLFKVLDDFGVDLGTELTIISYDEADDNHERINNAHAVFISGVPYLYPLEKAESLQPHLKRWLPEVTVPVFGDCLGHQAIGLAFGGNILREKEIEVGITTAEVLKRHENDPIFRGLGLSFNIACLHWASISIKNTDRINRLARSHPKKNVSDTGCLNQIIRIKGKQIYGTQFHPEDTEDGKQLLKNFLTLPREK